jgi:hypothetical protein
MPSIFSYQTGKRVVHKNYKFSVIDDVWPEDRKDGGKPGPVVKMLAPKVGRSFRFSRRIMIDTDLALKLLILSHL